MHVPTGPKILEYTGQKISQSCVLKFINPHHFLSCYSVAPLGEMHRHQLSA